MTIIIAIVSLMIGAALGAVTMAILAMGNDEENSAPDLLWALQLYLNASPQCKCTDSRSCTMAAAREAARAAIAKATTPRGV